MLAVFNRFLRTITNTRHTMSTVAVPNRLIINYANVIHNAFFLTQTATDTVIAYSKFFVFNKQRIKNIINNRAV